jgi:TonB family protein
MNRIKALLVAILLLVGFSSVVSGQETLAAAKALYTAAAYEDALTILTRLRSADSPAPGDRQSIDEYRAFCLLALGRQEEARQAIEALVTTDPSYQLSDADASPTVRAAFQEVRRRVLPSIAQQRYAAAKASYDRKEFPLAGEQFGEVVRMLETSDVDPTLADLKKVAEGFRDLSVAAAGQPAAPDPSAGPATQPPAAPEPAPAAPRVFAGEEPGLTPAVPIRQEMPRWPTMPFRVSGTMRGLLEVIIDETGAVESAVMRQSLNALYDDALLKQAKTWRYQPATKDGKPVKYLRRIQVVVNDR